MTRALALAAQGGGWGQTAPNPMVGAVVVADGKIVGEGFHARYGEAHAEVVALRAAGARARAATLYVNLEPCAHVGKTPPCTDAIIAAGIARVVAAVADPSEIARGGADRLKAAGVGVAFGPERDAALELNAPFFNAHGSDRPWVTLKLAMSADGAIASRTGQPRWITGEESRREVHRLRAGADAVAVGIGTVLSDDPALTVRDALPPRVQPARVVFDSTLRLPLDAQLVRSARELRTIAIATRPDADRRRALEAAGVSVLVAADTRAALVALRTLDLRSVLVEGGARLAESLFGDSLVDRVIIFESSIVLGPDALRAFEHAPTAEVALARASVIDRRTFGSDVMTIYAMRPVPCSPA